MDEFSWPDWSQSRYSEPRTREAWPETVRALPIGSRVEGEVVGRRPFGVFLRFERHPDAVDLAKIPSMPKCACLDLPLLTERVSGTVIWHDDHKCGLLIQLDAWAGHPDHWQAFADEVGTTATGEVVVDTPFGAFVRIDEWIQAFLRHAGPERADAPATELAEGQSIRVRIVEVDLFRHEVLLALA